VDVVTEWTPVSTERAPALILILSGPNLNLLGEREPAVYGTDTLDEHIEAATDEAERYGLGVERAAAIIVNPGALTHYGWSLHDALAAFAGPVVELHLSNPAGRETWRRTSVVAPVATGTIAGFGGRGYTLAVQAVADLLG
jgi:3-dehydroquinate dehydratase-2